MSTTLARQRYVCPGWSGRWISNSCSPCNTREMSVPSSRSSALVPALGDPVLRVPRLHGEEEAATVGLEQGGLGARRHADGRGREVAHLHHGAHGGGARRQVRLDHRAAHVLQHADQPRRGEHLDAAIAHGVGGLVGRDGPGDLVRRAGREVHGPRLYRGTAGRRNPARPRRAILAAVTRWIAAAGAGVISLDSIINVAFPAMAAAFAEPPERVRWVIVCYVFTYSVTAFWGGALADRVGHARVFRVGLVLTAVALALGGLAPAFGLLLAARVLPGLAGGLVYGTAPGLVTLTAPPEHRGRALGFLNAGIGVGFTVGPLVAGVLVAHLGWRSTFHVRVPIALAVFAWALAALPAARGAATRLVAAADVLRRAVLAPGALAVVANAPIFAGWRLAPFYPGAVRGPA